MPRRWLPGSAYPAVVRQIETDYLVVGAGASAMAFVDALLDTNPDADVVMVDRRFRPGGHWNDAYPFVRLHQPSANYGCHSRALGHDRIDEHGPNAGFYERATGAEVVDYFGRVMNETLLPSGRVTFLGKSDYRGHDHDGHHVVSLLNGEATQITVRRKFVDATIVESSIPSRHVPSFTVDDGVRFVTPNTLVDIADTAAGFTVLGAGKTAMDTCNWLLDNGVGADRIQWVRPSEMWLLNRAALQPLELLGALMAAQGAWVEAAAKVQTSAEWFLRLEDEAVTLRLDQSAEPASYHAALVSDREAKELRTIENVVRGARVQRLSPSTMYTSNGEIPLPVGQVVVDCTAAGIASYTPAPIFNGDRISMMYVIPGTVTWGAAMIGAAEGMGYDDATANALLPAITPPTTVDGIVPIIGTHLQGMMTRMADAQFSAWHDPSRVNMTRGLMDRLADPQVAEGMTRVMTHMGDAIANAARLGDVGATPHH